MTKHSRATLPDAASAVPEQGSSDQRLAADGQGLGKATLSPSFSKTS